MIVWLDKDEREAEYTFCEEGWGRMVEVNEATRERWFLALEAYEDVQDEMRRAYGPARR